MSSRVARQRTTSDPFRSQRVERVFQKVTIISVRKRKIERKLVQGSSETKGDLRIGLIIFPSNGLTLNKQTVDMQNALKRLAYKSFRYMDRRITSVLYSNQLP